MSQAENEETVDSEVQTAHPEVQTTEQTGDKPAGEGGEAPGGDGEDDEVVVSIGGESPTPEEDESRAPEWVRELRKQNREKDRRIRDLEARVASPAQGQPAAVVVGDKPTLEGCNYDGAKFEKDLEGWHERKREADAQRDQIAQAQQKVQQEWQGRLETYGKAKAAFKVKDYEDAEDAVKGGLSVVQQGVILTGADKAEVVVYALGKNPSKLKELAAIKDPVKFAFAIAKLETQLKVTPKKLAPPPERTVRSSVAGATAVDNQLEKLRAEADKTGDRSKVVAYMRDKRKASRE